MSADDRLDVQSGGGWVLACTDKTDLNGTPYKWFRPINYAYETTQKRTAAGLVRLDMAPRSFGPVLHGIRWPFEESTDRKVSEWSWAYGGVVDAVPQEPPEGRKTVDKSALDLGDFKVRAVYQGTKDAWIKSDVSTDKLAQLKASPPLGRVFPKKHPGVVVSGSDLGSHQPLFSPSGGVLVAPYRGGRKDFGTLVYDVAGDELDEELKAPLQSLVRVVKIPKVCPNAQFNFGSAGQHSIALQFGTAIKKLPGLGLFADDATGSIIPKPGLIQITKPGPVVQIVSPLSHRSSGPLHPGFGKADMHYLGTNKEGDEFSVGGIHTNAYFVRSGRQTGPLEFGGTYPPCAKHAIETEVYLSWDPSPPHAFTCGPRNGMWRWWTTVPVYNPEQPKPPYDGGGGRPGRPGDPGKPGIPGGGPIEQPPGTADGPTPVPGPNGSIIYLNPDGTITDNPAPSDGASQTGQTPSGFKGPVDVPLPGGGTITLNPDGSLTTPGERAGPTVVPGPGGVPVTLNPDGTIAFPGENKGPTVVPGPGGAPVTVNPDGSFSFPGEDRPVSEGGANTSEGSEANPNESVPQNARDRGTSLEYTASFTEFAAPGFLVRPQHFSRSHADLRNVKYPTTSQLSYLDRKAPVVGRLEGVGNENTSCSWDYTFNRGASRYGGGTASGALWALPGDVGLEQIFDGTVKETRSTFRFGISNYAMLGFGIPTRTGKVASGLQVRLSGSELVVDTTDSSGNVTATDTLWPLPVTGGSSDLDSILGTTRGSIPYRDASAWTALAPGTANYLIRSNGAGADPSYEKLDTIIDARVGITPGGALATNDGVILMRCGDVNGWQAITAPNGEAQVFASRTTVSEARPSWRNFSTFLDEAIVDGSFSGVRYPTWSIDQGTILFRGASWWQPLVPATAGKFLMTNGASANPSWETISTTSTDLDSVLGTTRGSVPYRNATAWTSLTPGVTGTVLRSNGSGADPSYDSIAAILETMASGSGSIAYRDGTSWSGYSLSALLNHTLGTGSGDRSVLVRPASTWAAATVATSAYSILAASTSSGPSFLTLSGLLDSVLGSTVGSIMTRKSGGWDILTPGASGTVLKSNGSGSELSWMSL